MCPALLSSLEKGLNTKAMKRNMTEQPGRVGYVRGLVLLSTSMMFQLNLRKAKEILKQNLPLTGPPD